MVRIKLLGGLPGHERKGGGFQTGYEVFSSDGLCPTILANGGGVRNYSIRGKNGRSKSYRTNG